MMVERVDAEALIDPQLRELAAQTPSVEFTNDGLPAIRAAIGAMLTAGDPPLMDGVVLRERLIVQGSLPPLRLLHYYPEGAPSSPLPAILHVHGGGFVLGLPEMNHATNVALTRNLQCHIISVDYRLAPEWPYPAALDDCQNALEWLFREAEAFGIDRARIGVKGESAGGGIAAALVLRDRDMGNARIAFQHLIYPMLDDQTGIVSTMPYFVGTIGWNASNNRFAWRSLLGHEPGRPETPAYASPARAKTLAGSPPTYLSVGTLDLFFGEILAFTARLRDAGVPVELHVYPGAFHGFDSAPGARVAQEARADSKRALNRSLDDKRTTKTVNG